MAAVTWKNIAPVSSAGILDSISKSGQQIGSGISGIGDAFTQYADDRSTLETNDLVAALVMAGNEADRDAIMQSMDPNSFADKSLVADAYKEANIVADPSWIDQQNLINKHKIAQIYAEGNVKKSGKDSKNYLNQYRADMIKNNSEAGTTSNWSLGIADIPADEVIDKLDNFFRDNNYTLDEQNRAIKVFKQAFRFDQSGIDEFMYGNKDVENLENVDLMDILKLGKFQTDAFIESEKEKKKTK